MIDVWLYNRANSWTGWLLDCHNEEPYFVDCGKYHIQRSLLDPRIILRFNVCLTTARYATEHAECLVTRTELMDSLFVITATLT